MKRKSKSNHKPAKPAKPAKARKAASVGDASRQLLPQESFPIAVTLKEADRPLLFDELAFRVGALSSVARARLTAEIEDAVHAGELVRNRRDEYCLRERLPLIVGTVSGHRDGHGFLHPEDRSAPIVLPHRQMREVMHGDRIAVRISGKDNRGRLEGAVVKVLERGTSEIVGRLYDESGISFVVPDNPRIGHRVLVPREHLAGATYGDRKSVV